MKKVKFLLILTLLLTVFQIQAQGLKTMKTYHDLWGTKLHEVYTVLGASGQKHGTYKAYDNEGFIYAMITYSKGIKNGPWKYYGFDNGGQEDREKVREEGSYLNGNEHGRYVYYNLINGKRQLSTEKQYDNGSVVEETWYYDNGKKKSYKCSNGIAREWYLNGVLKKESNMKDDSYEGEVKEYYENGSLQKLSNYKDGNLNGKVEEYYENGKLHQVQYFAEGMNADESINYNENGTINWRITLAKPVNGFIAYSGFTTYFKNGSKSSESKLIDAKRYLTICYDSISSAKVSKSIQSWKEVINRSNEGDSIEYYYPSGKIKEKHLRNAQKEYKKIYYKENGMLESVLDYSGSEDFYTNGILSTTIYSAGHSNSLLYKKYATNGDVVEEGILVEKGQTVPQKIFSEGVCVYEVNRRTGTEYWYFSNGKIQKKCEPNSLIVFEYNEQNKIISRSTRDGRYWVYNFPENISLIQAKGEMNKDGDRIGKWYLYDGKGKLKKIEEDGTIRKPTKDEKISHTSYLQFLLDVKP